MNCVLVLETLLVTLSTSLLGRGVMRPVEFLYSSQFSKVGCVSTVNALTNCDRLGPGCVGHLPAVRLSAWFH